jgi:hypothetical protein
METAMRKMILMLALASVAVPAMAEPQDGWADRRAARAEQRQQRAADAPRAEQPRDVRMSGEARGTWQRPEASPVQQAPQQERAMRGGWNRGGDSAQPMAQAPDAAQVARWRERQEQNRAEQANQGAVPATRWSDHVRQAPAGGYNQPVVQGQPAPVVRYGTRDGDPRQWSGRRATSGQWDGNRPAGQWQGRQYQGTQQQQQQARHWDGNRDGQRWSNEWRHNPRYDWQRYRTQNRSVFRVGRYYDPFGWGYRPVSIGFTLYSGYYQPNYWLDDPWQYRLPPVYGPYRWVRYYDDAVLVDIYSGEVVDVIQGFFW